MAEQDVQDGYDGEEIFAEAEAPQVRKVLAEIFAAMHPRLGEEKPPSDDDLYPGDGERIPPRITDFESLLTEVDSYDQTLKKFQGQIDQAEKVRDEVMEKLFEEIRPIEASYRQIWLFFELGRP